MEFFFWRMTRTLLHRATVINNGRTANQGVNTDIDVECLLAGHRRSISSMICSAHRIESAMAQIVAGTVLRARTAPVCVLRGWWRRSAAEMFGVRSLGAAIIFITCLLGRLKCPVFSKARAAFRMTDQNLSTRECAFSVQ